VNHENPRNGKDARVVVAGAGLVGSLLALLLKRRGYDVVLCERRSDPRAAGYVGGRSINLALSDRGLRALDLAGIRADVEQVALPMPGRRMHGVDGAGPFMPYGLNGEAIRSVSRGGLNIKLLDLLDQAGVPVHFEHRCDDADLALRRVRFSTPKGAVDFSGDVVVGADGAFSAVRYAMQRTDRFEYAQTYLPHGYKELAIPAGDDGAFLLDKNALHIWPRSSFMLIALPNVDGSFTCTLFFALEGERESFAALDTPPKARAFFADVFPDALALIPDFDAQWANNPVSSLCTVRCFPWHRGRTVLVGDAAHAIVPFFGQGMNCGFEDCTVLMQILDETNDDWDRALPLYSQRRKENGDAIATLALENFVEMREKVADPTFVYRKKVEAALARAFPDDVTPSYTMVTFRPDLPYAQALAKSRAQDRILDRLVADDRVRSLVEQVPLAGELRTIFRAAIDAATRG
jgi:kynurenine 3-monooxygenase